MYCSLYNQNIFTYLKVRTSSVSFPSSILSQQLSLISASLPFNWAVNGKLLYLTKVTEEINTLPTIILSAVPLQYSLNLGSD